MKNKRSIQLWHAGLVASIVVFFASLSLFRYFQSDSFIDPNVAKTTTVNFSFEPIHLLSPNRAYEIQNDFLLPEDGGRAEAHCVDDPRSLFLSRVGSSSRIEIFRINRNVDVSWSPDSQFFAISDWYGSDISESYICRLSDTQKQLPGKPEEKLISLRESLMSSDIPSDVKDIVATEDHNYISVVHWYGNRLLLIKASGHYSPSGGNMKEYSFLFSFDLKSNKWKLLKRMDYES